MKAVKNLVGMIVLLGMITTGCESSHPGLSWTGINNPGNPGPTTAQFRVHMDLVPEAKLVVEDTRPQWELGRYGYQSGQDDLIVASRITSFAKRDGTGRQDGIIERAWITVPDRPEIDRVYYMKELEERYESGYDAGEVDTGVFMMPNRLLGTMIVREKTEDFVRVELDLIVRPKRLSDWHLRGEYKLHRTEPVVYATKANPERVRQVLDGEDLIRDLFGGFDEPTQGSEEAGGNGTIATSTENPEGSGTDNGDPAARSIVGRWHADTPRWDIRYQFDADGRFVYANTRGGGNYAPGMQYGTWEIRRDKLIMTIERYHFNNLDHMRFLDKRIVVVDYRLEGNRLRLMGDFGGRLGRNNIILNPAQFPDMHQVEPSRGRGWSQRQR